MNRFLSSAVRAVSPLCGWVGLLALPLVGALAQEALPLPRLDPPVTAPPAVPAPSLPPSLPDPAGGAAVPVPSTPVAARAAGPMASSTSRSGQFIVHGPDLRIRSGLASRCEEIAEELNRLMRTPEPWVLKVVVEIKPLGPLDAPDLRISSQVSALTHGGFHLQLSVPERAGLRPSDFRRELVKLLLTERILRTHKHVAEDTSAKLLPDWVHTGVMEALDYKQRTRPSAEFAAIFKSGKVYGIEEILDAEVRGLDGLSRSIYETSSCALVLALLDQPEGAMRFSRFLAALAIEKKPQRELLNQWFPGLAESDSSLNKWWSLQLASLAKPTAAETLDPTATAELLDRALTFMVMPREQVKLPAPKSVRSIASQRPAPLPEPTAEEIKATTLAAVPTLPATAGASTKPAAPPTAAKPKPAGTASKKPAPAAAGAAKSVSRRPKDLPAAPEVPVETVMETEAEGETPKEGGSGRRGFMRFVFPFNVMGGGSEAKEAEGEEAAPTDEPKEEPKKAEDKKTEAKKEAPKTAEKAAAAPTEPAKEATTPEPAEGEMSERQKRRAERERVEAEEKAARDKAKAEKEAAEMAAKEAEEQKKAEERAAKTAEEEARKKAKEAERAAAKKPAAETPAEKTPPATEPEKPKEEGRGSKLNPFNWFRGGKKPEGGEAEAGKEGAARSWPEVDAVWARFAQQRAGALPALAGWKLAGVGRFVQAPAPPAKADAAPKLPPEDRPDLLELPMLKTPPVPGQLDGAPAASTDAAPAPTSPAPPTGNDAPVLATPIPLPPPIPNAPSTPAPLPAQAAVAGAVAFPMEDYAVILAHPDKKQLLASARLSLQEVQLRGNVLFRSVAGEYLLVLQDLMAGKTKGLDARLKTLREKAADAYAKACAVQDHLDWYEATQATRYSGLFEDFLNLPELIREELPPRDDPISRYLDEVEAQLGR